MRTLVGLVLVLIMVLFGVGAGQAAIYMFLPGIQGDVTEVNHVGWLELETISWGHNEAPTGATPKIQFARVQITKRSDSNSAALALIAASGQVFKDIKIEVTRSTGGANSVVSRMKLTNARLAAYASAVQSTQLTESLGWVFDTITWINFRVNGQGISSPGSAACWEVIAIKSCAVSY